jgi:hypothetical protein
MGKFKYGDSVIIKDSVFYEGSFFAVIRSFRFDKLYYNLFCTELDREVDGDFEEDELEGYKYG